MSLRSRWIIVPSLLLLIVLGWNVYVWTHDGGTIAGRVVDASGRGVADANVILYARSFVTNDERQRTKTDAQGGFRFTGNENHALQLQAEAPDYGQTDRVTLRLLFRGEDAALPAPLRFPAAPVKPSR